MDKNNFGDAIWNIEFLNESYEDDERLRTENSYL